MRSTTRVIIPFVLAIILTSSAQAEKMSPADSQQVVKAFTEMVGGSVDVKDEGNQRTIMLVVDREKIYEKRQFIQNIGLLNKELTETFLRTNKNAISLVLASYGAQFSVISEYENTSKADNVLLYAYAVVPDLYGQKEKQLLFSFRFTRAIYNKINWDNFDSSNLSKITKNYKMSAWMMGQFGGDHD